ncbi:MULTISPECIES: holin [unclassified Streptomyces]|uniref:holin n=1 Tax=unclassified Streptomyces TaxID=2593676 RepID=UPI002E140EB4|nr:holin [Streptomyces sp. NBC_01186]WSS41101.1 holin [Streptomyces sp. NBC_01187]
MSRQHPRRDISITTSAFWRATAEHAIRTFAQGRTRAFAQAVLALLGGDGLGLLDVDWGPRSPSAAWPPSSPCRPP